MYCSDYGVHIMCSGTENEHNVHMMMDRQVGCVFEQSIHLFFESERRKSNMYKKNKFYDDIRWRSLVVGIILCAVTYRVGIDTV